MQIARLIAKDLAHALLSAEAIGSEALPLGARFRRFGFRRRVGGGIVGGGVAPVLVA